MRSQINQQHLDGGGGERARTDDLLRARQALSQLSYTPAKLSHHVVLHPLKKDMVGLDGFEPSTSRLSGVRSNRTELQAPLTLPEACRRFAWHLIPQN